MRFLLQLKKWPLPKVPDKHPDLSQAEALKFFYYEDFIARHEIPNRHCPHQELSIQKTVSSNDSKHITLSFCSYIQRIIPRELNNREKVIGLVRKIIGSKILRNNFFYCQCNN